MAAWRRRFGMALSFRLAAHGLQVRLSHVARARLTDQFMPRPLRLAAEFAGIAAQWGCLMRALPLALLVVALAGVATDPADARTRHRRSSHPSTSTSTTIGTQSDIPMTDPNKWCTGGFPITDDQQIRGCTALIENKRNKDLHATAYYNRGNAYFSKGDVGSAIRDYTSALEAKPDYLEAIYNRAVARRATKDYATAIMDYSRVLTISPNDAAALTGRGTSYGMKGDNAHAIADLSQAITLGTRDITARLQRGHAYVRSQRWAEAIADYDQVLAAAPSNPEAFFGRACAKLYSNDKDAGMQDLTQAYLLDQSILETMVAQGISSPVVVKPTDAATMQTSHEREQRRPWETSRDGNEKPASDDKAAPAGDAKPADSSAMPAQSNNGGGN
jgi:tetratricopeptide (TPR) repeat protein